MEAKREGAATKSMLAGAEEGTKTMESFVEMFAPRAGLANLGPVGRDDPFDVEGREFRSRTEP